VSENAKRRSEARDRRRSAAGDRTPGEPNEQTRHEDGVHQAVRTAAAAAAVGAAVGAARALATRSDDKTDTDEREDRGEHEDRGEREDTVEPQDTVEPESQAQPKPDEERAPEPERPEQVPQPQPRQRQRRPSRREAEPRQGVSTDTVRSIVDRAREQLRDLHGKDPESVTSLERIGDGWRITFEVLEVERIPSSTDVLATYVVELDDDARLLSFERVRRYSRAQADRGDGR